MNCDPLARWYRWLEYFGMGRALERRRLEFLPKMAALRVGWADSKRVELPVPEADSHGRLGEASLRSKDEPLRGSRELRTGGQGLVLGDGDGRFLEKLLAVLLEVQVDYVDSSAEMLVLARERAEARFGAEQIAGKVEFYHADARDWLPPSGRKYDFVCTHFFLDCLTDAEVDELLRRLVPFTAEAAVWIVSEFHQPPRGFAAWRARVWIGGLYRLFGLTTGLRVRRLPDYRRSLRAHGFRMRREVLASAGLLVSEWWQRRVGGFCD